MDDGVAGIDGTDGATVPTAPWRRRGGRGGRACGRGAGSSGYSESQIATLAWYAEAGRETIELPGGSSGPSGVAFDGRYVWTTNQNTNDVSRIDPASGLGTNFAFNGSYPTAIAFDGTSIWATGFFTNSVSRIDPASGVETLFTLPGGADRPFAIASTAPTSGPRTCSAPT